MIDSVNTVSNAGINFTQAGSTRHVVSSEQKSAIESVLSKYDASALTQSDAQEISDSFKEMGVRPSKELRETIEASGFDADEIRNLNSSVEVRNTTPLASKKDDTEDITSFEEFLEELLALDIHKETPTASEAVEDYMSKYSNLTTEAKSEVKEIMAQLKEKDNNTQANTNNIMMSSVNDILSKYDNYEHVEVYA